jgi:hypothetical protein
MDNAVHIIKIEALNHNVVRLMLERPAGYVFTAGQAIDFKLERPGLEDKVSAFTFTGLATDPHLELTIKCYPEHHGITEQVAALKAGDAVLISDPFDTVALKGPGVFIAGGTGVTPFIAVLRQLQVEEKLTGNTLFHFNKTQADAFLVDEFTTMLGRDFHGVLSHEDAPGFLHGKVGADFLRTHIHDFRQPFYTCGPDGFVLAVKSALLELGANAELIDVQF